MSIKLILVSFLLTVLGFNTQQSQAQTFKVTPAIVNVNAGNTFEVTYSIQNVKRGQFIPPDFTNFTVVGGPNQFSSNNWVNGKYTSERSYSYILLPKKAGTLTLKGAAYIASNKTYNAKSVRVTVSGNIPPPDDPSLSKVPEKLGNAITPEEAEALPDLFYRIETDADTLFIGEQLTAYYVLYSSYSITNYSAINAPALKGYWVEDISPKRINSENVVFGDRIFQRYVIRKYALFPQLTGLVNIDPMELEIKYRRPAQKSAQRTNRFQYYSTQVQNINSETKEIFVEPLPAGAPEDFRGYVGSYKLNMRPDRTTTKVGEALTLNVGIIGNGNLKLVEPIVLPPSEDYEVYDPVTSENIYEKRNVIMGTKSFEYTIIPNKEGQITIPPLSLSYYNTKQNRYEVSKAPAQIIKVVPNDGIAGTSVSSELDKNILKDIALSTSLKKKGSSTIPSIILGGLYFIPFLLMPWLVSKKRKTELALEDTIGIRRRQAGKVAQQRLATAHSFMKRKEKKSFYDEIIKTIWEYFGGRFNLPATQLNKEIITQKLTDLSINSKDINDLSEVIDYCEMALFAPVKDADNLQKTYDATLQTITAIEAALETEDSK